MPRRQVAELQPSQVQASDYEIEPVYQAPAPRTNTELNMSVLKRYLPSITSILSIAASATIYTFHKTLQSWEKSGIEGTLFVCQCVCPRTGGETFCIVVLNRRALENLIVDVADLLSVDIKGEFLLLQVGFWDDEGEQSDKTLGVFMHPDKEDTMQTNSLLVRQCWEKTRGRGGSQPVEERGNDLGEHVPEQLHGRGRKLSLKDLFKS